MGTDAFRVFVPDLGVRFLTAKNFLESKEFSLLSPEKKGTQAFLVRNFPYGKPVWEKGKER